MQSNKGFLQSKAARILSVVLIAQAAILYGFSRAEERPDHTPLGQAPPVLGNWRQIGDHPLEKEVLDVLKADDTLSRTYATATGEEAHLFVAYFGSQRYGQTPHSPKNCLPGSGWVPSDAAEVTIPIAGRDPIPVNRYVVSKGDSKSLVLYWYQSRDRAVASEYTAKLYVIADAIRYNRSDTALMRVIVNVRNNNVDQAFKTAAEFVQSMYAPIRGHFPAS